MVINEQAVISGTINDRRKAERRKAPASVKVGIVLQMALCFLMGVLFALWFTGGFKI